MDRCVPKMGGSSTPLPPAVRVARAARRTMSRSRAAHRGPLDTAGAQALRLAAVRLAAVPLLAVPLLAVPLAVVEQRRGRDLAPGRERVRAGLPEQAPGWVPVRAPVETPPRRAIGR